MKIYSDLIDKDEKILWKKKLPPKNMIPEKKFDRIYLIPIGAILVVIIPFVSFILWIFYLSLRDNSIIGFIISFIGFFIILFMIILTKRHFSRDIERDWQRDLEIYQECLKYYTEEDLRNHSEYNIITNKKILMNRERNIEWRNKNITEIENVIELKKDFLIINVNSLSKVWFYPDWKQLYFVLNTKFRDIINDKGDDTQEAMSFYNISNQEYSEILKILFSLVPNLIVDTK